MAKLKAPLTSLKASGTISKAITFLRRSGHNIAEKKPELKDAQTTAQLSWRHMFLKVVALWHALSAAEKQEWESLARPRHMTGYAWFVSQALRPNPGIYLPLQGGTMQGDIDMDSYRLLNLIDPVAQQEPVTKQYFEDNLPVGGYTEGARVFNTLPLTLNSGITAVLTFNTERYDTDAIHSVVANTSRLTCKTAGKYVIAGTVRITHNVAGFRALMIHWQSGATSKIIATCRLDPVATGTWANTISTIYDLAINDYVDFWVYQDSGAGLTADAATNYSPEFMMQRIG